MSTLGNRRKRRAGLSYVETCMAIAILIVGFLGLYSSLEASGMIRETANETNVAMFKLQTALEHLFSMPFDDIPDILVEGQPIRFEQLTDSLPDNDFQLRDERITVAYINTAADPLYFTVRIDWTSRSGVARTEEISCARAR